MAIPKYYELYMPFMRVLGDGEVHVYKDIKKSVVDSLSLSEADLAERFSSGQTVIDNRIGWARTYLKKAGLIDSPRRAHLVITALGRELLLSGETITNEIMAEKSPAFAEFIGNRTGKQSSDDSSSANGTSSSTVNMDEISETPLESLERARKRIDEQLADDLLTEIMNQTPAFFEKMVVDLIEAMGYGKGDSTRLSGDAGIDGVINEDRLGFNRIYIQAKRWDPDNKVSRPELQKFAGAMMGPPRVERGLFITTAGFTAAAKEYAEAQHIVLVDGKKLCELMIEYNVGVSTAKTYFIKRVDSDYFAE